MAKGNPAVLAGLDLGTSKTAVAIAVVKNAALELLAVGESPSIGVQKGIVSDTDSAARSIRQALEKAEKAAGLKIDGVYTSHSGAGVQVRNCRIKDPAAGLPAHSAGRTKPHGLKVPAVAGIPRDEEPLQILSTRAGVPGLEDAVRAITAGTDDLTQLTQSVQLAGLELKGIIYGPLAAAEVLLTPAEREFGAILVDIGAGLTSVSIFDRCLLKETAVFALGGEHLASDLAIGLRTSLSKAQEIVWSTSLKTGPDRASLSCPAAGPGDPDAGQSREHLVKSIIETRAEEIIELIGQTIRNFHYPGTLPGGVVLAGGVSRLDGLAQLAEKRLQKLVKVDPAPLGGIVLSPACAGALGLVRYAFRCLALEGKDFRNKKNGRKRSAAKLLRWFQIRLSGDKACRSKNQ